MFAVVASPLFIELTFRTHFLNAVYFRRGLKCTLGWLTNDLIDGGQPRAKPRLRKAKTCFYKLFLALG